MPWQKGQSGNPNGRKPTGKTLAETLRKFVHKNANRQQLIAAIWDLAIGHLKLEIDKDGQERVYAVGPNSAAIAFIFERLDGKVTQPVEHSGAVEHHILDLSQFSHEERAKLHELAAEYARSSDS